MLPQLCFRNDLEGNMEQNIRGIKCSLDYYHLVDFLQVLLNKNWDFYAPWCLLDGFIPVIDCEDFLKDFSVFQNHRIWELELQCLPSNAIYSETLDYLGFCSSPCICYVLYFDCGYLEIYVKELEDFQTFWDFLVSINAEDLMILTDDNDTRIRFSVG